MILLIIKGTPEQAQAEADKRDIPIQIFPEQMRETETHAVCDDESATRAVDWFLGELDIDNEEYRPGTLLWYSQK